MEGGSLLGGLHESGRAERGPSRRLSADAGVLVARDVPAQRHTLFVLVGLEAQAAVRGLSGTDLTGALVTVAVVSVTLAVVRFTFLTASTCTIRLLTVDRRPQQLERRMGYRARVVSALAGFREAVSLALTLARSSHAWTSVVNE